MLGTLVCTMAMTLCVDVGWKTLENGEEVYTIQLQPEQVQQMLKDMGTDKGPVTCGGIPEGVRVIRVQFGNEVLMKTRVNPPPTETPTPASEAPASETQPPDIQPPGTQPGDPTTDPPPSTETPAPPGPLPGTDPSASTAPEIVTTSLDTPVNPIVPPDTPSVQKKDPSVTSKANKKPAPTDTGDSYLTTAIVSWIVSAALFGLLLYLGWIHLDTRRRYQALLNKTLSTRSGDLLPLSQHVETAPLGPLESAASATPPETKPEEPEIPAPVPMPEPVEPASPSEEPAETSTSIESKEEEWSEDLEPEPDEAWGEYDEEEDDDEEDEDEDPDFSNVMDATERLLENTNMAIAEASQDAERRRLAAEAEEELDDEPEEDENHPETVYELPDTSGGEPLEEDEDDKDRRR